MKVNKLFEMVDINRNDSFIVDNGYDVVKNRTNISTFRIKRYSVWVYEGQGRQRFEVVETADNLEYLMHKYNVPKERIKKYAS